TQDGPQPNMSRHRITYTRDAFWVKEVKAETVKELLLLMSECPNDFSIVLDEEMERFVIHELSDFVFEFKTLVLKIHRDQLNEEGLRLLMTEVVDENNKDRVSLYQDAEETIPETLYGRSHDHTDGEKTLVTLNDKSHVGTK